MKKKNGKRRSLNDTIQEYLQSGKLTQKELDEARAEVQREVAREALVKV